MRVDRLEVAIDEARRFIERGEEALLRVRAERLMVYGCKETGAVKRASMDLTRALAELRKPG